MLLWCFTVSYVVLAPFAGSFADSVPKGRAMLICNGVKLIGCCSMLVGMPPIIAYAIVGFGAAAYSPAKYGIVTEYLPHDRLVAANGWLEGATVAAIVFGTVLGGFLAGGNVDRWLDHTWLEPLNAPEFAISVVCLLYLAAAWVNWYIPKLDVHLKPIHFNLHFLLKEFWWCVQRLWKDPQGQLSLAVTTLFWGAGATMRLVVINWAIIWLEYTQEQATRLVALVAFGTAFGAILAGRFIPIRRAFVVLPAGVAMGAVVMTLLAVKDTFAAGLMMIFIGSLAGFFVVPLNAMLQHRGHMLMGAGHSIAVQNFNENLGILLMVGIHALVVRYLSTPLDPEASDAVKAAFGATGATPPMVGIVVGFGVFVMLLMLWISRRHRRGVAAGIMHD